MHKTKSVFNCILGVAAFVLGLTLLVCIALQIRPGENSSVSLSRGELVSRLETGVSLAKSDAFAGIARIRKTYRLPVEDLAGPVPAEEGFYTFPVFEADRVMDLIARAEDSGLLDGQSTVFSPDLNFYEKSEIACYLDDTTLILCWKELTDNKIISYAEAKIQDASQFRRKLSGDRFGSDSQSVTSEMSKAANAIIAMNGDYYNFRDYGISVYQGQLRRFSETSFSPGTVSYSYTDTCFLTGNGDLEYFRKGDVTTLEEMEKYIADRGVLWSLSFGPVLVDNYEIQPNLDDYPIGEATKKASRAGIAQVDTLHYLYMNISWTNPDWTLHGATYTMEAEYFRDKGVRSAYNLDGGQTAEITFRHVPFNYVDYGAERYNSDCIYFATALPDS